MQLGNRTDGWKEGDGWREGYWEGGKEGGKLRGSGKQAVRHSWGWGWLLGGPPEGLPPSCSAYSSASIDFYHVDDGCHVSSGWSGIGSLPWPPAVTHLQGLSLLQSPSPFTPI